MDVVKIRRQGNSLSVTLDQETLGAANLHEGDLVAPTVQKGVVLLTPVEIRPKVRPQVLRLGRRIIAENRGALDRLAKDDSGRTAAGRR